MKKSLCAVIIVANCLLANDDLLLDSALEQYNKKDFKASYEVLKTISTNNTNLTKLNFYLGRSAFELGKFEEAYSAFERVLINEPNHTRARLEYARTLYMLKMYEDAKLEFKKVQESNIPKAVKENIDLFLIAIEKGTQKHFLTQILMFGYQYDTNVNAVGNDFYLNNNNANSLLIDVGEQKNDSSFEQLYIANHRYDIGKIGEYTWDTTFLVYAQQYKATHNKNLEFASLNTGPTYAAAKYSFSLPLIYERLRYGSQTYLEVGGLAFKYNRFLTNTLILNNEISYKKKKNLIEANKSNDSNSKSISFGLYKIITQQDSFNGTILFEQERKNSDIYNTNVDQDKYKITLNYMHTFNEDYKVALGYENAKSRYKQIDTASNFTEKREDILANYNITFTKALTKSANLNFKVSRLENSSNQDPYKYEKNVYGLNLMYQF